MGRLFGTDGARGVANKELTCELAMQIGRAAAMVLSENYAKTPTVVIGKDTRLSSDMLEGALTAGLCSVGANVMSLGVVPTPAVAHLTKKFNANAGIMISASHNPFEFNGIKIFSASGFKLPDALEERIEAIVLDNAEPYTFAYGENLGHVIKVDDAADVYINHVISTIDGNLNGMNIALDCSNGSASATAKKLFASLGANCHVMFDKPDGININENCGSTHIEQLGKFVKENKLDVGLAFDGDADRCLAVDENGELVDGDFLIAICAKDLQNRGLLKNNAVVGTVMANMGFNRFCDENKMKFIPTKVGDRYVLEEMKEHGYNIGGEQSGHVIFLDYCTTGDGQLTGAQLLSLLNRNKIKLSQAAKIMQRLPQVMINVKITQEGKGCMGSDNDIQNEIKRVDEILSGTGRILVRESGTEPLIRVMLEGEDLDTITKLAEETAQIVKTKLGG